MFDENDLPDPVTKMQLYQMGTRMFTENGYTDIGMDHFALSTDEMVKARTMAVYIEILWDTLCRKRECYWG